MKKRNIYQNQSQEIVNLFEAAGSNEKVMCVPMDYAKNDHLVMFCDGHGDIFRKPFSVKNTPEGIAYINDQVMLRSCRRRGIKKEHVLFGGEDANSWAPIHKAEVKYTTWPDYVSIMNGHVLPVFKDSPIKEISYRDVVEFRSGLKVGSKRANNIVSLMKSVFDFADKEGYIQDNIIRKIKRLKEEEPEIHPFTFLEIDLILNAIDPWYRPYTCVGFFTGMRAGDINGLRWTDYLEDMKPDPKIFVRKAYVYKREGPPKTKKSKRYIKCLPQVIDALSEQKKLTGNKKYIFLDINGQRMTPDHFRNVVWTPALEKAGIAYRPPIQMRHTFATMMISAGEDIGWVQNMMGHSSLQMIYQRYYAWMDNATRTDGQAFLRHFENAGVKKPVSDKSRTNIVPLDDFRLKKGAGI